ncbi:MAG: acetyl-CoA carboxylase carboxyl transferase subunit alpha [Streptococcaceae bacterium]|jgi:acetyl-CoA carboxylase carboxyl transferase subunit alpha|nr:acetyl-CoA carboxylase carboxyl transferase subunit alpha [Streptococcaceae bacterium]
MSKLNANEIVKLARAKKRLTAREYIAEIFNEFVELHGDRTFRDDLAIVGGIALLKSQPVTVIGIQKGRDLKENMEVNFGQPHPEGYRKALRLMKQAEKFNRPVITLINTAGAFSGVGAEERGQGEAIARNLITMSDLKVPIIAVIIGEGGSGGALALAVANRVWMLENTIYTILSPEGFASILWKDSTRAKEAAKYMKLTATELLKMGVIDQILPETLNGKPLDPLKVAKIIKKALVEELKELSKMSIENLIKQRYQRFRKF